MDNSINFKGAFYVRNAAPLKEKILPKLNEKKDIVFDNLTKTGDALFVVKSQLDREIAEVIIAEPNVKFKYYPTLNRKSGFVRDDKEGAKELLHSVAKTVVDTKTKLLKAIRKPIDIRKTNLRRIQERNLKVMLSETFVDLKAISHKKTINDKTGVCTITTPVFDRKNNRMKEHTLFEITPPGSFGVSYAIYTPISENENVRKIAIQDGAKIFEYTKVGDRTFYDNAHAAKQLYREKNAANF